MLAKSENQKKCRTCLHKYLRGDNMVIQLAPNGEAEVLDGTRMPISEKTRMEFVKDAYRKHFHREYGKYGISDVDRELYDKWSRKIELFYTVAYRKTK